MGSAGEIATVAAPVLATQVIGSLGPAAFTFHREHRPLEAPSGTFNFRGQLKTLVYRAITD
jgi:hypothetical protein